MSFLDKIDSTNGFLMPETPEGTLQPLTSPFCRKEEAVRKGEKERKRSAS
jgi:hypothetical protein